MDNLLLCKFGELWLKSDQVKNKFLIQLVKNIKGNLYRGMVKFKVRYDRNRIFVSVPNSDTKVAIGIIQKVFGLVSVSQVIVVDTDKAILKKSVLDLAKIQLTKNKTFAVRVKRVGKHEFTSQEFAAEIGSWIVDTFTNKVNLSKPDVSFNLEIRSDKTYLFLDTFSCVGGLPISVEGSVIALIDSKEGVEAARLIMKRGCKIIVLASNISQLDIDYLKTYDPEILIIEGDTLDVDLIETLAKEHRCKAVCNSESVFELSDIDFKLNYPVLRPLI
ncbi:MAG: hypothetical protein K0B02_02490 [DPANN group archaeon]|nr:hypothetical protein [DPANN group archaeon]